MAKLHSKKKGRSGSKKSMYTKVQEWAELKPQEVEEIVVKLAKEGTSPSVIGVILRDSYGVGNVKLTTGRTLLQILKQHSLATEVPESLLNLIKRAVRMQKHMDANRQDVLNKAKLIGTESKIHRLVKYYKKRKVLPANWVYTKERGALLVK